MNCERRERKLVDTSTEDEEFPAKRQVLREWFRSTAHGSWHGRRDHLSFTHVSNRPGSVQRPPARLGPNFDWFLPEAIAYRSLARLSVVVHVATLTILLTVISIIISLI